MAHGSGGRSPRTRKLPEDVLLELRLGRDADLDYIETLCKNCKEAKRKYIFHVYRWPPTLGDNRFSNLVNALESRLRTALGQGFFKIEWKTTEEGVNYIKLIINPGLCFSYITSLRFKWMFWGAVITILSLCAYMLVISPEVLPIVLKTLANEIFSMALSLVVSLLFLLRDIVEKAQRRV